MYNLGILPAAASIDIWWKFTFAINIYIILLSFLHDYDRTLKACIQVTIFILLPLFIKIVTCVAASTCTANGGFFLHDVNMVKL